MNMQQRTTQDMGIDGFLDRYAGRRMSPQEMIRANAAAEAAENERLRAQREQYRKEAAAFRQNAEQTRVAIQNIEDLVRNRPEVDHTEEVLEALKALTEKIDKHFDTTDEAVHETGVRVYRNVQASVIEELEKQSTALTERMSDNTAVEDQLSTIRRSTDGLSSVIRETGEAIAARFSDQAEEEKQYLLEQMKQIAAGLEESKTAAEAGERSLRPLVLLSLMMGVANLAVTLLHIFGII
ncbi:MAG: hypothetical protein IJT34_05610 [Butyrivibrio sp.]|nr:hypothetical protein [Butyrivibrio sp.]